MNLNVFLAEIFNVKMFALASSAQNCIGNAFTDW